MQFFFRDPSLLSRKWESVEWNRAPQCCWDYDVKWGLKDMKRSDSLKRMHRSDDEKRLGMKWNNYVRANFELASKI